MITLLEITLAQDVERSQWSFGIRGNSPTDLVQLMRKGELSKSY
jgi:hypothetical protein